MSYQSLIIRDRGSWDAYVEKSYFHEAFHSWDYHTLNQAGEPMLFVHQEDDLFIAMPVIKRAIEDSPFFDMTSVYGYSGPISNGNLLNIGKVTISKFRDAFINFMIEEQAICIFSRLHPFGCQQRILEAIGGVKANGRTLYMDLTLPVAQQEAAYDRRLFRQIKKLRKSNYRVIECSDDHAIRAFADIYYQNMDRLNVSTRYYFDVKYFTGLLNMPGFDNKLLLIYDGVNLICGAILLISQYIIRNHLSATSNDYFKDSPSKLLTDEISAIGRRMGKTIFHLGGGVGGTEDSLFEFKRRFSDLQVEDFMWCYINDEDNYNQLVNRTKQESTLNYFPLYRQQKQTSPFGNLGVD